MTKHHSSDKIYLTVEAIKDLKDELERRIKLERPKIIQDIKEARAQGDLSENSEFDAAREKQGQNEDRIKEIENILEKSETIKNHKSNRNGIGKKVKFKNLETGIISEIKIVSSLEADPTNNLISNEAPIAKALVDSKVGDKREVEVENKYEIEILEISM